jgi:hypothetical protein
MKKYKVTFQFQAEFICEVDAEDEDSAIEKADENLYDAIDLSSFNMVMINQTPEATEI